MTTWKDVERRIARKFGTERTPLSGGNGKQTRSDTLHTKLFIEIKHRVRIPFYSTFRETRDLARKENKTPMVISHETNSHSEIVMIELRDFLTLCHPDIIRSPGTGMKGQEGIITTDDNKARRM